MDFLDRAIYPKHYGAQWIEKKYDTEYAFWVEDDNAFLAFQGSYSITDWIFNFLIFNIFRKYFFHYGMYKKYEILEDEIFKFVDFNKDKNLYFIGHSQGAGVALIALILMKRKFSDKNLKAVLFGCPKILSLVSIFSSSLKKIKEHITLYEIRTDIVPKLIPWNYKLGCVKKLGEKAPFWQWKTSDHYPKKYKKYL